MLQRKAPSVVALARWLSASTEWLDVANGERHVSTIPEDDPVLLDGTDGAWCWSADIDDQSALMNIIRTTDTPHSATFFTVVHFIAGGTYIKQVASSSIRAVIDELDEILDWDAIHPPIWLRRFLRAREVISSPSTITLEGEVDGVPAKVMVVATQPSRPSQKASRSPSFH